MIHATIRRQRIDALWLLLALLASTSAAEAPSEPAAVKKDDASGEKTRIEWKDGKTTLTMEKAQISLSNRFQFRFTEQMPDDGRLVDLCLAWTGDDALVRKVLVDNPARLYGWG